MATNENNESGLPEEILIHILSYHLLPSAVIIDRQRYEDINIPRGPIIKDGMIKSYSDNDLHTGACMHQHEEWRLRLRTLSASAKTSRQFHRLTITLLYQVYPGQILVKPDLFLRSLNKRPDLALLVKELVLDPWDAFNAPKDFTAAFNALMIRSPNFSALQLLEQTAKTWNDEPHALLLLFRFPQIHTLSLATPPVAGDDSAMSALLNQLRRLGPNTLGRTPSETFDPSNDHLPSAS
ncbi:hypothetical protein TI39_contig475g00026 [Zymoseptoria brevis]|uniref:Uncharacterized protein n=1 Tax=Zymoseptoria brevis TaxID=1047168 RepID=A0A0F4GKP3_9PEZI|nr:hypothetical protein TI39_contig475g00026 [Zymoseptoria brevis]